jgi:hypothetical protein
MAVLRKLLTAHPGLRAEAEQVAKATLREVSFEAVADEVEGAVTALDHEDFKGRVGKHAWGYTEPGEAANELLEEAVAPFLDDMKRLLDLGLEEQACEICKGIVLGLYRVRDGKGGDVFQWAPDFPIEQASWVASAWRGDGHGKPRSRPKRVFPKEFVNQHTPEWRWLIAQKPKGA